MNSAKSVKSPVVLYKPQRVRIWLGLILTANFLVTVAYGVVNPLFEAPDEQFHYYTAQRIVETGQLPFVPPGEIDDEWISQEAAQPPLYYLLSAALLAPIDTRNARDEIWPNKYPAMGEAGALNNRNIFIHTLSEAWPWQGYAMAAHLLRGLSALLGVGTLWCIFSSGRLLWPDDPFRPLLATGLVAFLPQFNFLFASISNDPSIIFLCAAAIWMLIRLWSEGATRGRMLLLGITIGLAMLSKNAGLILLFYATGFIVLLTMRDQGKFAGRPLVSIEQTDQNPGTLSGPRLLRVMIIFMILPAILIGGWVLVRNYMLYGDITAANQFLRFSSGDRGFTIFQVLGESGGLWLSLIAVFGWFNIRPPDWIYWYWNGVVVVAIAGAAWNWLRQSRKPVEEEKVNKQALKWENKFSRLLQKQWTLPLLLAGWVILIYVSLFLFMLRTEAAQGRLLFPALVPLILGLAYGWTAITSLRRLSILLPPIALLITLYCLLLVIRPAYAVPMTLTAIPEEAQELNVELGRGIKLVGSKMETEVAAAGDPVWMTLYYRADPAPEKAVDQVLSIFGRDMNEVGKLHSYHGRGLYPANLWPTGKLIADRFAVQLNEEISTPVLARIESGLAGEGFSVHVGEVKIIPDKWPDPVKQKLANLNEFITLTFVEIDPAQAKAGDKIDLDVQWHVLSTPERDFTTLVHLGQPNQTPLAVGDRPPLDGAYPTRIWEAGEVIDDAYTLILPAGLSPGRYPLWLGMYDTHTFERLPVTVNGEPQPNNVILAGWVEIE